MEGLRKGSGRSGTSQTKVGGEVGIGCGEWSSESYETRRNQNDSGHSNKGEPQDGTDVTGRGSSDESPRQNSVRVE